MLDNLSEEQEEMLLACLKEVFRFTQEKEGDASQQAFIEKLAQDENMLKRLTEMVEKYRNRGNGGGMHRQAHLGGGGGGSGANYPHIY